MMHLTKAARIAIPAVLGVGLVTVAVVAGNRERHKVTIPAGTAIVAALGHEVSTERSQIGEEVTLRTIEPLPVEDGEIPAGVVIRGTVTEARGGGRVAGAPELALRFTQLEVDGEQHEISAATFQVTGKSDAGESAAQIGGGAVAGGVLGTVLGGKGGTLKGAVVGAAIGTGVALATEGDHLVLHPGQQLRIRLNAPVTVSYRPASESEPAGP
jgi:hypothetical protein